MENIQNLSSSSSQLSELPHAMYETLIDQYVSMNKEHDANAIKQGKEFFVDDIEFRLQYSPAIASGVLQVLCNVWKVIPEKEEKIFAELVTANLYLHRRGDPIMTLSPEKSIIMSMLRLPLENTTPTLLDDALKHIAKDALLWRERIVSL